MSQAAIQSLMLTAPCVASLYWLGAFCAVWQAIPGYVIYQGPLSQHSIKQTNKQTMRHEVNCIALLNFYTLFSLFSRVSCDIWL